MYGELFDLNLELIMEHTKRATNHAELLLALKEVNQMIQKAARLRMGGAKTRIIAAVIRLSNRTTSRTCSRFSTLQRQVMMR